MLKKSFLITILGLGISSAAFALNESTITVLNYTANPIDIRVYDATYTQILDVPIMMNESAKGHWFTAYYLGRDVFDSVHVFALDKTSNAMVHCGDIPGGETIPLFTNVDKVYEIDECRVGTQGPVLKWHPV